MQPPTEKILLIAGVDPSGCAGIAADLKTCMALGAYGLPVVTTVTAQNTVAVTGIQPVSASLLHAQLETVLSDIEVRAVKIGLITDPSHVEVLVSMLNKFRLTNIVVDPVLRSTTGFKFSDSTLTRAYLEQLFPVVDVITPNIDEASALSGLNVIDVASMKEAAGRLNAGGARNVVITGGHLPGSAVDVLYDGSTYQIFEAKKIEPVNVRGLGCTFSTALAIQLARGKNLPLAIRAAKELIARAMADPHKIGNGRGALRL